MSVNRSISPVGVKRRVIQVPLTSFFKITANDVPAVAAVGGRLALDTAPKLKRFNGVTDKSLIIQWAAADRTEIQTQITTPVDFDPTQPVVVYVKGKMGGATDTPPAAVGYFSGVAATDGGGNTANYAATVSRPGVTINSAQVKPYPLQVSLTIIPGVHATDTFEIHNVEMEYGIK